MVLLLRSPFSPATFADASPLLAVPSAMLQHQATRGRLFACFWYLRLPTSYCGLIINKKPVISLLSTSSCNIPILATKKIFPVKALVAPNKIVLSAVSIADGFPSCPSLGPKNYYFYGSAFFSTKTTVKYHSVVKNSKKKIISEDKGGGGDIDRLKQSLKSSNKKRSIVGSDSLMTVSNKSSTRKKTKSRSEEDSLENGKLGTGDLNDVKAAVRKKNKATELKKGRSEKNKKPHVGRLASRNEITRVEVSKVSKRPSRPRHLKPANISYEANSSNQRITNGTINDWEKQLTSLYPPSARSLVIVESVTKAKVIQKYLGDMFDVLPSYGHIRELARRAGSVCPEEDFNMAWEVPSAAQKRLKSIMEALNGVKYLILASDPDREGEAIAWHVRETLYQRDALTSDIIVARVTFSEITETAIKSALSSPRSIDMDLVNAYLARCALDYLIGFNISPLLWRKLPGCRSAGRVQSAALALICDREAEIEQFKPQEYWTVGVDFQCKSSGFLEDERFPSQLTHMNAEKLNQFSICSGSEAKNVEKCIYPCEFQVLGVKRSLVYKTPPSPYVTSTLQQDAANRLHFPAQYTMKLAQMLYEGVKLSDEEATGLITYMRTDGSHISDEAAEDIRNFVEERYGKEYASRNTRKYFKKVKNAQEAHEAIRPTSVRRLPSTLVGILDDDTLKLYTLIWARTMACQMEPIRNDMVQVEIGNTAGTILFRSVGSRVHFAGYRVVYKDIETRNCITDEEDGTAEDAFNVLCKLKEKDLILLAEVHLRQHYTKPPSRFSEGSLVRKLEDLGIGRPSTYASTMKVLKDRKYVTMKGRILHPEFRGRMVSAFLSRYFSEVVNYSFTAEMETELDNISAGTTDWKSFLKNYWERFQEYCDISRNVDIREIERMLEQKFSNKIFSRLDNNQICPCCSEGKLIFKVSKYGEGYFIACDNYPNCKFIANTIHCGDEGTYKAGKSSEHSPKLLGIFPGSKTKVFLKYGPYGYYVQLGEDQKRRSPKRASVNEDIKDVNSITLEEAVELLRYPLTLGDHPDDNQPVIITRSKYGYSIKHGRSISKVPKDTDPKKIMLEDALGYLRLKSKKSQNRKSKSPMQVAL